MLKNSSTNSIENTRKIVLYVGNFLYPDGNAAGKRVYGNLEAISKAGYKSVCLCFRKDNSSNELEMSKHGETDLFTIPYSNGFKRLNNKIPINAFNEVLTHYSNENIKCIIMYNSLGTTRFNKMVINACKSNKIKVIYDIVDYFDEPSKYNYLRYIMKKLELNSLLNNVIPNCDNWITISNYLKEKMPDPNKVLLVPPLSRTHYYEDRIEESDLVFSYATFIVDVNRPVDEWKDRIDAVIDIFYIIHNIHLINNFKIKFIGFTEIDLLNMFPYELKGEYERKLETLRHKIVYYPPMANAKVQEEIIKSDFMVILRDKKISSDAGFPTKISEAISVGVPVITNITSDINLYLKDGVNSIIVPSPGNLAEVIEKILVLFKYNRTDLNVLRKNTYINNPFYYADYIEKFKNFLEVL